MRRNPKPPAGRNQIGFTIVELLVVIAIIGLLMAVTLPAIQMARESARNTQCRNNLRQVGLAVNSYAQHNEEFLPAYWATANELPWENFSWRTTLLPFLDNAAIVDSIDFAVPPLSEPNLPYVSPIVEVFQCPSTPGSPRRVRQFGFGAQLPDGGVGASDYVGVFDVTAPTRLYPLRGAFNGSPDLQHIMESPDFATDPGPSDGEGTPTAGVDQLTPSLRVPASSFRRITDGLSRTILVIEQAAKPRLVSVDDDETAEPKEGAWATTDYGSFHQTRINWNNFTGPYGFHRAVNFVMCDGSVHSLVEGTDPLIVVALMSIDGSEIVNDNDWK